ncbi:MAG: nucleotide exchange factor GrpE [Syntrophomonadaceae bacterium]|nr:nucleotide exchange factor GrpE [Syntrophomonadaceae bacterium]
MKNYDLTEELNLESSSEPAPAEENNQDTLQTEINRLKEEASRNYDKYLRAVAEADNIRKRASREREEYLKYASIPIIKKILSVTDDLDRAIKMSVDNKDYDSLKKGLEIIARRMDEILEEEGVEYIDATGKTFDPQFHEPLVVESGTDHPENTIIEELQKGYILHGRVIRPSLVKVSN